VVRFGKACRYQADPRNFADKRTVAGVYEIQLWEYREERRYEIVSMLSRKAFMESSGRGRRNSENAISAATCGTGSAWHLSYAGIIGKESANRFDAKAPRSRQFGNSKMLFVFDIGAAGVVLRQNEDAGGGIPRAEL
jgi:hypothetical protein